MAKAVFALIFFALLTSGVHAAQPKKTAPSWDELTTEQKQILAPLEPDWNGFDAVRRRKWVGIAKRYPTMGPEEKQKVERRMRPWASITPEERRLAREQYKKIERLPASKRGELRSQWEEYNQLPEDERVRLRNSPAKSSVPKPASKPGAPQVAPTRPSDASQ